MSNVFTLDSLREEATNRFAPTTVVLSDGSSVELKSVLRLGQNDRDAVLAAIDEINSIEQGEEDDEELIEEWAEKVCVCIAKILRLIASSPRKLMLELDHDDPQIKAHMYTSVITEWIGKSQLGEAEPSPS